MYDLKQNPSGLRVGVALCLITTIVGLSMVTYYMVYVRSVESRERSANFNSIVCHAHHSNVKIAT